MSSHATLQTLTKKQLINHTKNLRRDLLKVKKQQKRVQEKIERMFKDECITLDEQSGKDIKQVVEEASPQKIIWQEQRKALKIEDRRQLRWHPTIIRWAIPVHSKSPAAYKLIKDSGFMILPAIGTLHRYTQYYFESLYHCVYLDFL